MARTYDVIVVGGGTSGLEAAKTAAQAGLRVALLERKSDPAKVQRSCAQMFLMNMDSFYNEHMYFCERTQKWVFPVNNFSVTYTGGYRKFYACHFIAPNARDRIEIGDYESNASGQGVAACVFNKNDLLRGLFDEGRHAGVDYFLERNVTAVFPHSGRCVEVKTAEGDRLAGTFCIAADGINSRIARLTGMNRQRIFLFTAGSVSYYITGVQFDRSEVICMGNAYDHNGLGMVHFCMLPSVYRDDEYWLYIGGDEKLDFFIRRSAFSHWFKNIEITHKRSAVITAWSPTPEPFKDNVVFVGDSCWFAEAENTGALLSGHRAALAVAEALHRGMPNRKGVMNYLTWWKRNWPETHDYKSFLCYAVFFKLFDEDELNYLHALIRHKLPWSLNPFNLAGHIMHALKPHRERIRRERPALARKLNRFGPETSIALMKPATRPGFPTL